jgi:hypothetical protein
MAKPALARRDMEPVICAVSNRAAGDIESISRDFESA